MPPRSARTNVDDEIRAVYHGALADFVASRQALAKRLKLEGDARASEVKELKKPSLSAWAVNQLFAHEGKAMAAFVAWGEKARAAQQRVQRGGDPKPLREALAAIASETTRLHRRGVELLAAAERAPGEAIVERVRTNVEALALDPQTAAVAARGWLDDDLEAPGFEVMAALQVAAMGARPAKGGASAASFGKAATAPGKALGGIAAMPARAGKAAVAEPPSSQPAAATSAGSVGRKSTAAAAKPAPAPPAPARPPATVHSFADARAAAAERRAREARERQERERGERIEKLRAELERAESTAKEQRREADEAAKAAERTAREASEAAKRARETRQSAISAEAIAARLRESLRRAEHGAP